MSKSCISPNLPKVVEFVKNMQPMFGGFLNDNQIVGLLNNWIDAKNVETYPTADELVAFFAESKESVPEKENVLDVIQSLYFEWLKDFSGSPIITREIVNKYSAEIFEALPLLFRDENLGFIAANFNNYKELLLKTRLQHVAVPIDELLVDADADTKDRVGEHASNMDDLMGRGSDKVKYLFASLQSDEKIYGLNRPANYTKCWNVVQGLLQNTVNLDEQIAILQTNRTAYPFIDQIIDKLGAETESLEYTDLQTSFYESFCKANYDITIAQQGEKQSYSEVHLKTKNGLISQYKSNFRNSKYAKRVAGNLIVDKDTINEVLPTELSNEAFIKFLNAFGIPIKELPESLQHVPNKNTPVSRLMHFVKNNKDAGLDWLIAEGNFGKNTEQGNFDKVLDYLTEKEKGEIKTSVRNAEGETINTIANHNYFTRLFNGLKNLLNKNKFQELLSSNKVIANIASGLKRGDESKNFNKLGLGEIYVAKISNMFSGEPSINIPVTSDKTLVRTIKFRRPTSGSVEEYYNDMMAYTAIGPQLYTRLFEVYQRDLNSKFSPNWKYGSEDAIDYWHGTETKDGIFGKINTPLSKDGFILKVDAYLETQNALLKESLVKSGAISIVGESVNANFNFPKVQGTNMEKLNTTLNLVNFNELLFGTEITQEMYGSMVGTVTEDFFKRNAGGVAEGRQVRVDDIINKAIQTDRSNSVLNMANYPMGKLKVLIHAKTKQSSTNKELIAKYLDYKNLDVDDAQGTMPLEMYREVLQRSSQWKDAQEKAYQNIISGKKLNSKELKEVQGIFPPIKPVGYSLVTITDKKGVSYKVPVYIKTAVYPIFKTDSVGTLNEAKYDMMSSKGVGLVIPVSGIKMATPKNAKNLFNKDGQINFDEVNTIDFPMEDFRIQLDINQKTSNDLLQGTQQRKLQYTDLFEGGKAINPKFQKLLSENIETLQEMSDIETQKLYAKAGIVETVDEAGNPDYSIKDYNKLVKMLRDELLNRNMSTNTVEAIKSIVSDRGLLLSTIDGLPSRQKLMNLLNSIVTNKLIKLQTNGASLVQISQHGWEMAPIADATDEKILAAKCAIDFLSNDHKLEYYKNKGLKFFSLGKETGAAQIILPAKYKKFVTLKDGKYVIDDAKCLLNIGYRIPTQGHNSMLHLEVVGFLPEHMDQMVIMPKEITTQGGSDFDVDKLNIFIPNVISSNGKKLFIDAEMDGEVAWKDYVATKDPKNAALSAEEKEFFSTIEYTDEELSDIVDTQNLNKEEFLQTFRVKQLQNKLITQAIQILEDPEVRSKLLTPNSAESLKNEAEKLAAELKARGLQPVEIVPTYANMLSSRTLAEMAYQMSAAKALVGVFASQSTNHTLAQQVGLHFKTGRPLFFEHNTIDVDVPTREGFKKETFIDLSGTKSKDGKYIISYMLGNEYLTAAVDAAKKDYLSELGVNLRTGDFVAAYTRMGGSTDYLRYWMKNPIIKEYLRRTEINDSLSIPQFKKTSKSQIIRDIAKDYGVKNIEYIADKYDGNSDLANELKEARMTKPNKGQYSAAKLKKLALLEETNNDVSFDLLNDYLYFEDAALVIRQNISNTKFDVAGPGKDIVETKLLQLSYDAFLSQMSLPFGYTLGTSREGTQFGYEALVTDTQLNVFYKKSFKFVQSIYKDLVLLEKDQVLAGAVSSLIANSPYTYKKASPEEAALVYGTAINYIIQQDNPLKESLFFGDNTVAHKIQKIQSDENNPLNKNFIIQEIQTEIAAAQNNPSLIGFKNKNITALESDYISKAFGEIKELNKELYDDLIAASLYQTGVVQSPLSYYNLVPYSDILPIINKALNNHGAVILGGSHTTELIASIIANVGDKLKNIQRANISEADIIGERDIYGTIELPLDKTKEKELIKLRISIGSGSHQGFYIGVGNNRYKYIAPKNYKGLFYNLTKTNLEFASEEDSDSDVVETEPVFLPVAAKSQLSINVKREYTPENITSLKPNKVSAIEVAEVNSINPYLLNNLKDGVVVNLDELHVEDKTNARVADKLKEEISEKYTKNITDPYEKKIVKDNIKKIVSYIKGASFASLYTSVDSYLQNADNFFNAVSKDLYDEIFDRSNYYERELENLKLIFIDSKTNKKYDFEYQSKGYTSPIAFQKVNVDVILGKDGKPVKRDELLEKIANGDIIIDYIINEDFYKEKVPNEQKRTVTSKNLKKEDLQEIINKEVKYLKTSIINKNIYYKYFTSTDKIQHLLVVPSDGPAQIQAPAITDTSKISDNPLIQNTWTSLPSSVKDLLASSITPEYFISLSQKQQTDLINRFKGQNTTNPKNTYLQLASNLVNPAIEELDKYLLDFLKNFNVKSKQFEELKSKLGIDALGATDSLNKLIWYVKNRNEETLPEESAHMLVALMGEKHPDINELLSNITNWSEYNDIKNQYLPIYKDENKVKIEAVGKLIAKSLVKNYKLNGLDKNKLQKALDRILNFVKSILDSMDFNNVFMYNESVADHIAINVLSGNKDYIYKIKNLNPNLNAEEEINNNPNAKKIINKFSSNNVKMTGSLAIAGTENIRRPKGQGIHDIDFKVKSFDLFEKEVLPKIPNNAVPAHYGWHKKEYSTFAYLIPLEGHRIEVLERKDDFSNGFITEYKLYNEKNKEIEITQSNVMAVDFFVYKEGNDQKDFNFSSNFIPASLVYEGKMSLGGKTNPYFFSRDKDQEDFVLRNPESFIPFEKYVYYQLPNNSQTQRPETSDEVFTKITWASLTDNERAGLLKHVSPNMFESLTEEVQKNMIKCFKIK